MSTNAGVNIDEFTDSIVAQAFVAKRVDAAMTRRVLWCALLAWQVPEVTLATTWRSQYGTPWRDSAFIRDFTERTQAAYKRRYGIAIWALLLLWIISGLIVQLILRWIDKDPTVAGVRLLQLNDLKEQARKRLYPDGE